MVTKFRVLAVASFFIALVSSTLGLGAEKKTHVDISWGHRSAAIAPFEISVVPQGISILDSRGGENHQHLGVTLQYADDAMKVVEPTNPIWLDLFAQSDANTVRRLRLDPGIRRDPRKLTVLLNPEGTRGFSVTLDQLLANEAIWVPSLDVYLAVGDPPLPFAEHQKQLERWKGERVLDRVHREPEATYAQYTARWEDMGSPSYVRQSQPAPGHIIDVTWDSAIPKFGIDRGAGVWNDYGNPDRFRFWFDFGQIDAALKGTWRGQRLLDGLPVVSTVIEKEGIRYEVEQFAYPLDGPPAQRRGDITMVLFQKVRAVNLGAEARTISLGMTHRRTLADADKLGLVAVRQGGGLLVEKSRSQDVLLAIQGSGAGDGTLKGLAEKPAKAGQGPAQVVADLGFSLAIPAGGARELVVKLPSPSVSAHDRDKLLALDYAAARAATIKFWSDYLARGAQFCVPEKAVNDLFRANLWHALRLPRRHGGSEPGVQIDLPYSNFAYGQSGTPWPVNQAVYVDYMLYDLRGYHDIALEELLAIYRNNQEHNGHVGGNANWGTYTPGMLYSSAKYHLLSQNRAGFERLLPPTLKALDWCLAEVQRHAGDRSPASGLYRAPLNDGTGMGVWAFNQAYMYAGLQTLGQALQRFGHPRARECLDAAQSFRRSVERAYAVASVQSPLVQLRDHTWCPYVPNEVLTPHRLTEQWYPTDVDSGAVHLLRLEALPAVGLLADCLLDDQEDNLFLHGWGMANEPVYNQQATAYLLRDDPKAVIRDFYSMMACAFSHSTFEPVEHRWTWGQFFGPPSTDGAWFELYRNMLVRESDADSLLLFQATPRDWLQDGKRIDIRRAPTYYGTLSASLQSRAAAGQISADLDTAFSRTPKTLLVRFRHPQGKPMRSVTINGENWTAIDREKEWVIIANPSRPRYAIVVQY